MPPKAKTARDSKPKATTLFHSELVKVKGPVKLTILSECQKPARGKEFVEVVYGGEQRQYVVDNPNLAAFFAGQVGRTFQVLAEGRKGDETLTYIGEAIPDTARGKVTAPAPKMGTTPPKREEPPHAPAAHTDKHHKERTEEEKIEYYAGAIHEVKLLVGRHTVLAAICSDAAELVAKRHELKHGKAMTDERIQGIAMRFMIGCESKVGSLPTNIDKYMPVVKPPEPADQDGANAQ